MRTTTLNLMAKIENRLNTMVRLAETHCGHEADLARAQRHWRRTMKFLEAEIDALVEKASLP